MNPPQPVPLGPRERTANLERMASEPIDVLVIGGGITGAAVARDLALRGVAVALVEKEDFAAGTSSRSSQLIHGGLRYLQNLDFGLVFEALRERRRLLVTAPHLVRAQKFLFPVHRDDQTGPLRLRLGLVLYDLLAGFRSIGRHHMIKPAEAGALEPELETTDLTAIASYFDATTNDARLTLTTIRSAAAAGALVVNHAAAVDLIEGPDGRVGGARVSDAISGTDLDVRAHITANAAGVWAPEVLAMTGATPPATVRPSKGSHLVLDRERLPVRHAFIFESPVDHRIVFVIPWGWYTVVGTTEAEHSGPPGAVTATAEEVDYLLVSLRKLFPGAEVSARDICGAYAGLRPLAAGEDADLGSVSREHAIADRPPGLFTMVGGKLTTHRLMAEQLGDRVAAELRDRFGVDAATRSASRNVPLVGAPAPGRVSAATEEATWAAVQLGLPDTAGDHLVRRFGLEYRDILRRIERDSEMTELLAPPLPYSVAEVMYAAEMEMAQTLTDFMVRRTHLLYAGADANLEIAERVANRLAGPLGWDRQEVERQLEDYGQVRDRHRVPSPA